MGKSKYNEDYIRKFLSELGCELISEYKNVKTKFRYRCSCGEESEGTFDGFKNSGQKGCNKCSGQRTNKQNTLTYDFVKEYFEKQGCTLLEKEYVNSKTKMKYICQCKNEAMIAWNHFRKGQRCKQCATKKTSDKQRHDFQVIKTFFEEHGCQLLSDNYENTYSSLNYICSCGIKVSKSFSAFKSSPKCNCHIKKVERKIYTRQELINVFWNYFNENGIYLTPIALSRDNCLPSKHSYIRIWGKWDNFLNELGLLGSNGWYKHDEEILKTKFNYKKVRI